MTRSLSILIVLLATVEAAAQHCRIYVEENASGVSSIGSGTLIAKNDTNGLVLTCGHIFDDGVRSITVSFPDGSRYGGRLVGMDRARDLAAVLVKTPTTEPAAVNESELTQTVTVNGFGGDGRFRQASGNIVGEAVDRQDGHTSTIASVGVRSGDSGGGVFNAHNELIGVLWGCESGRTYFTSGEQVTVFLAQCWGGRCPVGPQYRPAATRPPTAAPAVTDPPFVTEPQPQFTPLADWQAWIEQNDERLAEIETSIANISTTPGPPGPAGPAGAQGPAGESSTIDIDQLAIDISNRVSEKFETRISSIEQQLTQQPEPDKSAADGGRLYLRVLPH